MNRWAIVVRPYGTGCVCKTAAISRAAVTHYYFGADDAVAPAIDSRRRGGNRVLDDLEHLDIEDQILSGQRVIRVDGNCLFRDFGDRGRDGFAVGLLNLESLAHLRRQIVRQMFLRDLLREIVASRTIGLFGRNLNGLGLSGGHPFGRLFDSGQDLALTQRKLDRRRIVRRCEYCPIGQLAGHV